MHFVDFVFAKVSDNFKKRLDLQNEFDHRIYNIRRPGTIKPIPVYSRREIEEH